MAFEQYLASEYLSSSWLAVYGIIFFVLILAWFLLRRSNSSAEYGGWREKEMEQMAGSQFTQAAESIRKIQNQEEAVEKGEEKIEAEEQAEESIEKKGHASESEIMGTKAAEEEVLAAEQEAIAEKETAAVEGRAIGLAAATQETVNAIIQFVMNREKSETKEEQEIPVVEELMKRIKNTINYSQMDSRVAEHLKGFSEKLVEYLGQIKDDEKTKEQEMKQLIHYGKKVVKEMREVINGAKKDLQKVKKAESAERKHYDKEMKDIKKSIDGKRDELKKVRKHGKKANPQIIATLEREIKLASDQADTAGKINDTLKQTYKVMKNEIKEMRKILNKVTKSDRSQKKYERAINKREGQIEKRYGKLEKAFDEIKKDVDAFAPGTSPQSMTVTLSKDLDNFFNMFEEIVKQDMEFDSGVKNMANENIVIAQQVVAFEKLQESLTESEEGVEKGGAAVTELITAIISNQKAKSNAKKILSDLAASTSMMDYEKKIEKFMEAMEQRIEKQSAAASNEIDKLVAMDKKTLQEIEAGNTTNQNYLGSTMATVAARKEAVDAKYRPQADKFAEQLKQRNEIAAASYKQAINAERKAA